MAGRLAYLDTNDKPVLIYATFPDFAAAEAACGPLVEAGLAACINLLPGMVSIYRWEGAMQRDQECVAIIKTRRGMAEAAIAAAKSRHPYLTPAFLVIPVEGGLPAYLNWLMAGTRG